MNLVHKKSSGNVVVFLVLYVDDILLVGNDVGILSLVKVWLSVQFDIKDLGEVSHILGIKLLRDRQKRMLGLFQSDSCQVHHERFQKNIYSFQS